MSDNPFWDEINEVLEKGLREMYANEAYSYIDNDDDIDLEIAEEGLREFFKNTFERVSNANIYRKMTKDIQQSLGDRRIRALSFSKTFLVADKYLRKNLKKYDNFSINKEAYEKIIEYVNQTRPLIEKTLDLTYDRFENDPYYNKPELFMFKDIDKERDQNLIDDISKKIDEFNDFFKINNLQEVEMSPERFLNRYLRNGITSTEEITISYDDIVNMFLTEDDVNRISKLRKSLLKLEKEIGIEVLSDDDEFGTEPDKLFKKYKKYIEVHQPFSSINFNHITGNDFESPIASYCYYMIQLAHFLSWNIFVVLGYNDGAYNILRHAKGIKNGKKSDRSVLNDFFNLSES